MLSIERTKELIDPNMSDEEAVAYRDACWALAEIIVASYEQEMASRKLAKSNHDHIHHIDQSDREDHRGPDAESDYQS